MDDLERISNQYQKLNEKTLVELAGDPNSLRLDAIPILQKELLNRGLTNCSSKLEEFLINIRKNNNAKDHSNNEFDTSVSDRLNGAESLEKLKSSIRDNKVNVYDADFQVYSDETLDQITHPKLNAFSELVSEIEIIHAELETNYSSKFDRRLNTISEVNVYRDIQLVSLIRKEPKNKLLPFDREIIRNGNKLLVVKEHSGEKYYILKDENYLSICEKCQVKEYPVDFLLMSHNDYDKYIFYSKIEKLKFRADDTGMVSSHLGVKDGFFYARIKSTNMKDTEQVKSFDVIIFNIAAKNKIKIGQLQPNATFYCISAIEHDKPQKIKTDDGREGVLLNHSDSYDRIREPLERGVLILSKTIAVMIFLSIIVIVLANTGYIVIIGILLLPLLYLST